MRDQSLSFIIIRESEDLCNTFNYFAGAKQITQVAASDQLGLAILQVMKLKNYQIAPD